MFAIFLDRANPQAGDSLLDVGVTADREFESSNYLEAWYPFKDRITAVGLDDASFLEKSYPGVRFLRADGRALPFADASFDIVHSSAVIEHVGGSECQFRLLCELLRVTRRVVFVTTPNRWFPVEYHTVLPIVHWLPNTLFRSVLRALGEHFLAQEENLNLLGPRALIRLTQGLPPCHCQLDLISIAGWPSNLLLTIKKPGASH